MDHLLYNSFLSSYPHCEVGTYYIHMYRPWRHVIGMLDCAPLIIVSDVCLIIQVPVAEWLRHWYCKREIPGLIPGRANFSFSLYYLLTSKQLKSNICSSIISIKDLRNTSINGLALKIQTNKSNLRLGHPVII